MKKDLLKKIKGEILNAKEAKMIQGGYDVSACNAPRCSKSHPPVSHNVWCGSSYVSLYWENFQYCRS